jgi:hypothetical protein
MRAVGIQSRSARGRWGISTKVHLPPQAAQIAAKLALPEPIVDDEGVNVCNNAFTYGLLRMGFRMGRNAERIAELAAKFGDGAEAFMAGAALAA